jgi:hypothetical protein
MLNLSTRRVAAAIAAAPLLPGFGSVASAGSVNTLVCELRGGQEFPPTGSPALGCGRFVIDTNANTLSFYIVFGGMMGAETAAHIHGPAGPGANAGVLFNLPAGSPKVGVWNYPEALEQDILECRTYVNVHSSVFPGGEIRGQVCKAVAHLDANQEVPPTACPGAGGWGVFSIDPCADTLSYHIVLEGALCGVETAAHIHGFTEHASNAGVVHPLPLGSPKIGVWNYPADMEDEILQGLTYVNVHTDMFPGGVIRGQITQIVAPVDSAQEVPPSGTPAVGVAMISIDKAGDDLGYHIRRAGLTTAETAAHIHGFAPPGGNAGVLHALPAGSPKVGVWNYAAAQEPSIEAGLTYINIHTSAFPGGEIRGQVEIPAKKPQCPWDLDSDCIVGITDLLTLLGLWGPSQGHPADFDDDGIIGINDLLELLPHWGPCPG